MKIVDYILRETAHILFRTFSPRYKYLGIMSASDTESNFRGCKGRGVLREKVTVTKSKSSNFTLLLKVVQINGKPLPVGSFYCESCCKQGEEDHWL